RTSGEAPGVVRKDDAGSPSRPMRGGARGPVGLDVRYELAPAAGGSEVTASVSLRRGGGISGRLISQATAALLSAGALDGAARGIARAAEA
ncbi:MAG: hypothetical protein ACREX8_08545, partial [Gammaproteobacteria bacterium]